MDLLAKIGSFLLAPVIAFTGFLGDLFTTPVDAPMYDDTEAVGRAVNPIGGKTYTLYGGGISASDTAITLSSFTIPVSNVQYTMANFGEGVNAKGYLTLEPGSATKQEFISFTGLVDNADETVTLTGVSRGLLPIPPYTASSTYAKAHAGGSVVVISNPPQLYEAIYSYIDNATTSGAVDGTTLVKGIYETATGQEAASTTQIGGGNTTATLALTSLISTSTAPSSGNWIPVTKSDGKLALGFARTSTTTNYTSSTTYTKPSNLAYLDVEMWGAGGGGRTSAVGGAGGGGGGEYKIFKVPANALSSTTAIVIGTGGAPNSSGGNTFFGNLVAFGGGGGGTTGNAAFGGSGGFMTNNGSSSPQGYIGSAVCNAFGGCYNNGGTPTTTVMNGGAGGSQNAPSGAAGSSIYGGGGGGGADNAVSGTAGTSILGGNGGAGAASGSASNGSVPGGGGGGAYNGTGGSGGNGMVRITEYY